MILHYVGKGIVVALLLYCFWYVYRQPSRNMTRNLLLITFGYWTLVKVYKMLTSVPYGDTVAMLHPPVLFLDLIVILIPLFYLREQIQPGSISYKKFFYHLLPFVMLIIAYYAGTAFFPDKDYYYLNDLISNIDTYGVFMRLFFIASTVAYTIYSIIQIYKSLNRHEKLVAHTLSYTENVTLQWLRVVMFAFAVAILGYLSIYINKSTILGDLLYLDVVMLIWSYLFYHWVRHEPLPVMIEEMEATPASKHGESNVGNTNASVTVNPNNKVLLKKIFAAFENDKLHLNPRLTIMDLATACQTNRTYISSLLNNELQISFSDFVNQYRVEHVSIPMLEDIDSNHSMEDIAEASGFGSITTFRRTFVKHIKRTPQQYRMYAAMKGE